MKSRKAKQDMQIRNSYLGLEDFLPFRLLEHSRRILLIVTASVIMAVNIKSFVGAGGLFPGGFNGLTLLIQRSFEKYYSISLPFSLINFLLNAVPAVLSYKYIGRRFTVYSCLMVILTSFLTDSIPYMPITDDILLICIFGGLINGFAVSLCLWGRATSGGTDFIAVFLSLHKNINAWNYILYGNAVLLIVAGLLFGWDKALYSIIFQFASTQVVKMLDSRYKRATLFIVSHKTEAIFDDIIKGTHHGGTVFRGKGLYNDKETDMLYTVVSGPEVKQVIRRVREMDPEAFINVVRSDQISGNFYIQPHD